MKSFEASLRLLIENWIGPPVASQVSLTRYGRAHSFEPRYVRVEARRAGGAVGIFFFSTETEHGMCSRRNPGVCR